MDVVLILFLVACAPLTDGEMSTYLVGQTKLLDIVEGSLQPIEKKTAMIAHGQGDGTYAVSGTLDGPGEGSWSGSMDVTGTGTASGGGTVLQYTLTLAFNDVGLDGLHLDGTETASLQIQEQSDIVSALYVVKGTLDLSGTATGRVRADYQSFQQSGGPITFKGTVNGVDVAGFSGK